jgi:hypothetical protein
MGQMIYGQIIAVLWFLVSVLNKFLSVHVSFSRLNFEPAAGLYSWYDGVQNLPLYLDGNVEFDSNSSVGIVALSVRSSLFRHRHR